MTHQSGNIIIRSLDAPIAGSSHFKYRDLLCLVVGFVLGALIF